MTYSFSQKLPCVRFCQSNAQIGLEKSELRNGKVILPSSSESGVSGWVNSGEGPEVVRKMRLVIITALEGQFCPGHGRASVQNSQGGLKTAYAAPHFGAYTNLFAKYLR
jgi:hypothetical protein